MTADSHLFKYLIPSIASLFLPRERSRINDREGKERKKSHRQSCAAIERVNDTWASTESPRGRRNIFLSVVTRSVIRVCMQASKRGKIFIARIHPRSKVSKYFLQKN